MAGLQHGRRNIHGRLQVMNQDEDQYMVRERSARKKLTHRLVLFPEIDWRCEAPKLALPFPRRPAPKDTHSEIDELIHFERFDLPTFINIEVVIYEHRLLGYQRILQRKRAPLVLGQVREYPLFSLVA